MTNNSYSLIFINLILKMQPYVGLLGCPTIVPLDLFTIPTGVNDSGRRAGALPALGTGSFLRREDDTCVWGEEGTQVGQGTPGQEKTQRETHRQAADCLHWVVTREAGRCKLGGSRPSAVVNLQHQAEGLGLSKGCRGGPGKSSEGLCHGGRLREKH